MAVCCLLVSVRGGVLLYCGDLRCSVFFAEKVAFLLPTETNILIAGHTLETLDKYLLGGATSVDEQKQKELVDSFNRLLKDLPEGFRYRLLFRDGGELGANALALPDGAVIVTDQLIEIAEEHEEVVSVLAHELGGHVVRRHGVRTVLQSSVVSAVAIAFTGGDISSLTIGIPTLLVESKYSKVFEKEADRFAVDMLKAQGGIEEVHFANMLTRLSNINGGGGESKILTYISSHPSTKERVQMIKNSSVKDHTNE